MIRIKELLKEKGMTTLELSEMVDVTPQNLSKLINEKTKPSLATYEKIADALDVHISKLFENDGVTGFIKANGEIREISSIGDLEKLLDELKTEK